jgi:hypothetical protein
MRTFGRITIATSIALALTACGKKEEAPVTEASEVAVATDAPAAAPTPGTYEIYDAAGKLLGTNTINADGGYARTMTGAPREAGIMKMVDGKTCFDPSGKAEPECFTDSAPGADGSFSATDAKGVVLTIRPKAK